MLQVYVSRLGDIAPRLEAVVSLIGLAGLLVPVGGPDAPGAGFLKGIMEPSDSAEEINEGRLERGHVGIGAYFGATSRTNRRDRANLSVFRFFGLLCSC